MVILYSLTLLLLALHSSASFIDNKPASLTTLFEKLTKFQKELGIAGIILGVVYLINQLDKLGQIRVAPSHILLGLLSAFITIGLGLIYGYDTLRSQFKEPDNFFFKKVERYRQFVISYQKPISFLGVALGVLTFIANV